jgi:uracil-DNA glycosylase family 4
MKKQKPNLLPDHCPVCGERLVLPYGPDDAIAVVVSNQPGEFEVNHRRPFVPQAPAGKVLHKEMRLAGLDIDEFMLTNVWLHPPNDRCFDWHSEQTAQLLMGRRAVLLLGALVCMTYLGVSVMSCSGIVQRKRYLIAGETPLVVAGPNPADALHGTIGEVRLAIERFAEAYKKMKGA